jgi:hypothetical protein
MLDVEDNVTLGQTFLRVLTVSPSVSFHHCSILISTFEGALIIRAKERSLEPSKETDAPSEVGRTQTQNNVRSFPITLHTFKHEAKTTRRHAVMPWLEFVSIQEAGVQFSIPVPTVQTVFICSYCKIGNNQFLHSIYAHSFHLTSLGKAITSERKQ